MGRKVQCAQFWGTAYCRDRARIQVTEISGRAGEVIACAFLRPGLQTVLGGLEAVKALRTDTRFKDTLIVALTGFGDEQTRLAARQAGFNGYYVKPVYFPSLTTVLRAGVGE